MSKRTILVILLALGFGGLLTVGAIGTCVYVLVRGNSEVSGALDEYLTRVHSGEAPAVYADLAEEWKRTWPKEQFLSFYRGVNDALGNYRSGRTNNIQLSANKNGRQARGTYAARFVNGPATINFTLSHERGRWRVLRVHYASPVIDELLLCAECGERANQLTPFCPTCGTRKEDMTGDDSWNDEARDDLRGDLREAVRGELRLYKNTPDEIIEYCREVHIDDECPESERSEFLQFAKSQLADAASALAAEQEKWPDVTDCDRLDKAEQALREAGLLLWQASPCCDTCSGAELPDRIDAIESRHPGFRKKLRGYAFFHDQGLPEMLAEGSEISVYLAYGWFSPDDSDVAPEVYEEKALAVAAEVCEQLRAQGLTVDWEGDFSKKIGLSLDWRRRAPLE